MNKKPLNQTLPIFFFIILFVALFGYYRTIKPYSFGDTAFLIEVVSNIAGGEPGVSRILSQNSAEIKLATAELEIFCQKGLAASDFSMDPYHVINLHAYVILYLIIPIVWLLGPLNTLSALTALAFACIPYVCFTYLKKQNVSVLIAILSMAFFMVHPAWLISSNGQFYVDRLFVPLALLYVLLLHHYFVSHGKNTSDDHPLSILWPISTGLLGGLTSERNMLIIGLFSMAYALLAKTDLKKKGIIAGFSIICVAYVVIYTKFFGGTADNATVQSRLIHWPSLIDAIARPGIGEYLLFNSVLLILPALFYPRLFFAVLPIAAINCFITIGGAEKNGWATHYHSHYYGFIVAADLIALANAKIKLKLASSAIVQQSLPYIMIFLAVISFGSFQYYYKGQGVFTFLWDYYGRPKALSASRANKDMFDKLAELVPRGATVTSTEWGMAAWYLHGNKVNIFPLGVGLNEYIMVQAEGEIPNIKIFSAVRYKPDVAQANECHSSTIGSDYEKISQQGSWVLFKKKGQADAKRKNVSFQNPLPDYDSKHITES